MGKAPRRHHFLPKSYLDGFTNGGLIWLYDRSKKEYRRQPPINTAVIKDFYVFENVDGKSDFGLETFFSKIEGGAKEAIVDLEKGEKISPETRLALAHFIAFLMVRSPKFDRQMQEIADTAFKALIKHSCPTVEAADAMARQYANELGEKKMTGESLFKFIHEERFTVRAPRNEVIQAMLDLAEKVTFEIAMMDWVVVHAEEPKSFITSDEPIGYIVPEELRQSGEPVIGLASERITKIIPLSHKIALLLGKIGGGFGHLPFGRDQVREANLLIATESDRYVIGRDEALVRSIVASAGVDKGNPGTQLKMKHIPHPTDPNRTFLITQRVMPGHEVSGIPAALTTGRKYPERFSLEENQQAVLEFEKLLRQYGMEIPTGSPLEDASLAIMEMVELRKDKSIHNKKIDCRERWRQAFFIADVARKALRTRNHSNFGNLIPHLRLLLESCNLSQFSKTPSTASPIERDTNNKIFELFMAMILFQICSNLQFDDPIKSKGRNPDIIGEFKGKRWGFACKVSHSDNPLTFLDRVRDGIDQIEKAAVDKGLIIICLKNLVPHDITWPAKFDEETGEWIYRAFPISDDGSKFIQSAFEKFQQSLALATLGLERFQNFFVGKKAIPMVLIFYCSVTSCSPKYGVIVPTIVKRMIGLGVPVEKLSSEEREVLELVNDYLHDRTD